MPTTPPRYLHLSIVFVWIWTGMASLLEWHGQSTALLRSADMTPPSLDDTLILAGAALDLAIGLWMLLRPSRPAYGAALVAMAGMTVTATVLLPDLWLHPLGPLSKNLPIAAGLCWLLQTHQDVERRRTS